MRVAGAPLDLRSEASLLALRAAQDRDTPTALGLATYGGVYVMATGGQPLEMATELAARTGEGNAYWLGFGEYAVGHWRMSAAREAGDYEWAVRTAETLRPDIYADRWREARYWVNYGIALSRLRRRRTDDAVLAFRRAEAISTHHVHRDPFARESLAGLLTRVPRESPTARCCGEWPTAPVCSCSPTGW